MTIRAKPKTRLI